MSSELWRDLFQTEHGKKRSYDTASPYHKVRWIDDCMDLYYENARLPFMFGEIYKAFMLHESDPGEIIGIILRKDPNGIYTRVGAITITFVSESLQNKFIAALPVEEVEVI